MFHLRSKSWWSEWACCRLQRMQAWWWACWAHTREQKLVAAAFVWWAFKTARKLPENSGVFWRHWLPLLWHYPLAFAVDTFTLAGFSPGLSLYVYNKDPTNKNAVVAVWMPQKGTMGGWGQCSSKYTKKTNLLMGFSLRTLWKSQRVLCWKPRRAKLSSGIKEVQVGCFWMLLVSIWVLKLVGFLPSTTRPICLEVGPSNSRTVESVFHTALQREASLEDGSVTGFSSVTLLLMLVRSWVSTGSEVNYEFVFCLETSIKFNVQLFEFIVFTLDSWPSDEVDVASR